MLPRFWSSARQRRQRGFTLIELVLVLGVSSMITLLTFQNMQRGTESNQASIVGQQMKIVGQGVDNYISNRYSQITQLTTVANNPSNTSDPGPRTCTAATSTCVITVTTLVNEGLLPSNYANRNSFGSGYNIIIKVSGTTPNWQVNSVITTANPWTSGTLVRYDLLGQAMQAAGPDSGMTRALSTRLDGYNGIWNEASTTYSNISQVGQLGFRAGYGSVLYSAYLRRDGTLPMTGDLNMSDGTNHNIANAGNITGTGILTMNQVTTNYEKLNGNLDMTGTASIAGNLSVAGTGTISKTLTVGSNALVYGSGQVNGGLTVYNSENVASGDLSVASGNMVLNTAGRGLFNNAGDVYLESVGNAYLNPFSGGETITGGGGGSGQLLVTGNQYNNNLLILQGQNAGVGGGCGNGWIGYDGQGVLVCRNGVWRVPGNGVINQRSGDASNTQSVAYCAGNETMTGGICWGRDNCSGNDSSAFGGYPSGNAMVCPRTTANVGCDTIIAYAFCGL